MRYVTLNDDLRQVFGRDQTTVNGKIAVRVQEKLLSKAILPLATVAKIVSRLPLPLPECIFLLFKHFWEKFILRLTKRTPSSGTIQEDAAGLDRLIAQFNKPSLQRVIKSLRVLELPSPDGALEITVKEIFLHRLFLRGIDSREVQTWVAEWKKQQALMDETVTPGQQELFLSERTRLLRNHEELKDLYFDFDSAQLEGRQTENRWYAIFGSEYLHLQEQNDRLREARFRLELKDINPDYTRADLDTFLDASRKADSEKLQNLRLEIAWSQFGQLNGEGHFADERLIASINEQAKAELQQIKFRTHPDRLQQHPRFKELTPKNRRELLDLFSWATSTKFRELGFNPDQVGFNHRSVEVLRGYNTKIDKILSFAGIDLNCDLLTEGETINENIEWARRENSRLDEEIRQVKNELIRLLENADVREKRIQISCPELHDQVREQLRAQTEQCAREAEQCERELALRFQEG